MSVPRTINRLIRPTQREVRPRRLLTREERGVLLALVYADVFDFAVTRNELFERVIDSRLDRDTFEECVRGLSASVVHDTGKYVCLRGREHLIELRSRRKEFADHLWTHAHRFARWFRYVPFVRAVAVSGSLAVGNAGQKSDVDLFCITTENRLWISRLFIIPLSKATRCLPSIFPVYLCPNYVIDRSSLNVEDRNLFTAFEITQAVPLWGFCVHEAFVSANEWTSSLLPNVCRVGDPSRTGEPPLKRPLAIRLCERLLSGHLGDRLNDAAYRLFVFFYRRRAERRGWPWSRLAAAYQVGRYTVPEGGYTAVVAKIFRDRVREVAGDTIPEDAIDRFFPPHYDGTSVHDWPSLFAQEYGPAA